MCSISTERYTGITIEQGTQQAVPCDSNQYRLITVLCVLAQLMIFVHTQHACYILLQWKLCCFLSLYSIVPGDINCVFLWENQKKLIFNTSIWSICQKRLYKYLLSLIHNISDSHSQISWNRSTVCTSKMLHIEQYASQVSFEGNYNIFLCNTIMNLKFSWTCLAMR